jgi:hypothetical protein
MRMKEDDAIFTLLFAKVLLPDLSWSNTSSLRPRNELKYAVGINALLTCTVPVVKKFTQTAGSTAGTNSEKGGCDEYDPHWK